MTVVVRRRGDYLATCGGDGSAYVWDTNTGKEKQEFRFHTAAVLDVAWKEDNVLATASVDKLIYVCTVGNKQPTHSFSGHTDDVNCISWDPSGTLVASASDDRTAKV